ncbi:MAG TPA: transposase [Pyrinomonadaceae bacterium]|jgi:REP element-mobilizing transposase RayT
MKAEFRNEEFPLAYLITFRSYGTWLHGDGRGSVDRFHNRYGAPRIPANERWRKYNRDLLKHTPVKLTRPQRTLVEQAIRETCKMRKWDLWATNVRSNHVHTVASASCKPEIVLAAFKANATRKLRENGCWHSSRSPWIDRGSKRYLWTEADVINAVAYVEYDQGEPLVN